MDEIKLLKLIEKDARISVKDLADVLNENESDVLDQISKLEQQQIICGYHTVINWDKAHNETVSALIEVGATPSKETGYDAIAEKIYRYPEVTTMYLMSGKSEFIVVINGKTMRQVADFVAQKLAPIEGVHRTETYFVLKQYKVEGVVVLSKPNEDKRLIVTP